MQKIKKPTIWRYLIWGLIIGGIASYVLVKFFIMDGLVTKNTLFQQLFGNPFSYKVIDCNGNVVTKQYYEYVTDLFVIFLLGGILGLVVGISNYSFKKTIISIMSGLTAGCLITYVYFDLASIPDFFTNIPHLLFWYAALITLSMFLIRKEKKSIILYTVVSIIASFIVTQFVYVLGWLSLFASIGEGFAGRASEIPQVIVCTIAITLLNTTINLPVWKMGK